MSSAASLQHPGQRHLWRREERQTHRDTQQRAADFEIQSHIPSGRRHRLHSFVGFHLVFELLPIKLLGGSSRTIAVMCPLCRPKIWRRRMPPWPFSFPEICAISAQVAAGSDTLLLRHPFPAGYMGQKQAACEWKGLSLSWPIGGSLPLRCQGLRHLQPQGQPWPSQCGAAAFHSAGEGSAHTCFGRRSR